MPRPELQAALARLRERYAGTAVTIVATFDAIADRLEAGPMAADALEALRNEAHRVHGTAGSHGFHEASRLAAEMERVAAGWIAQLAAGAPGRDRAEAPGHDRIEAPGRHRAVRTFARELERALRFPVAGQP